MRHILLLAALAAISSIAQAQDRPKAKAKAAPEPPEGVRIERDVAYLEPGRAEKAASTAPLYDWSPRNP